MRIITHEQAHRAPGNDAAAAPRRLAPDTRADSNAATCVSIERQGRTRVLRQGRRHVACVLGRGHR